MSHAFLFVLFSIMLLSLNWPLLLTSVCTDRHAVTVCCQWYEWIFRVVAAEVALQLLPSVAYQNIPAGISYQVTSLALQYCHHI